MVQTERETGALRGQFARQVAVQASAAAQAESARAQAEQLSRKLAAARAEVRRYQTRMFAFERTLLALKHDNAELEAACEQAWEQLGAERVVLARELSLAEISEISAKTSVELETFVHGAMCISYSGRCLLSAYLTGRDGNRGACTQACRWEYNMYKLGEQKRPGEYFDLEEDERGTYVMNSKDLCLIEYLPELMRAGVCSLKIEGRMKSVHYVATVVSVYRKAIDQCWADMEHYSVPEAWITELNKVSHRQYTTGFAVAKPDRNAQVYTSSKYEQTHDFVGIVTGYDAEKKRAYFEQRNNVKAGEPLELLMPDGSTMPFVLTEMLDEAGTPIDCAPHAQQKFSAASDKPLLQFSLLRRKVVKE
jgi:putative protease